MVELFHYVCLNNRGLTVFLLTKMLCHLVILLISLHTYTQLFEVHTHVFAVCVFFLVLILYIHTYILYMRICVKRSTIFMKIFVYFHICVILI